MEAMPTVSSSVEKLPQIPHISLTQRHQTIRHPEKCSKPENDAICGLTPLTSSAKLSRCSVANWSGLSFTKSGHRIVLRRCWHEHSRPDRKEDPAARGEAVL